MILGLLLMTVRYRWARLLDATPPMLFRTAIPPDRHMPVREAINAMTAQRQRGHAIRYGIQNPLYTVKYPQHTDLGHGIGWGVCVWIVAPGTR